MFANKAVKHVLCCYYFCFENYQSQNIFKRFLAKVLYKYYSSILAIFYGSYIPYRATLGKGLRFNHGFHGVFISEHAVIGSRVTILQNVTIGSNQPKNNDAPVIGDDEFIGVGAIIVGKAVIKDRVVVGAGTVISSGLIDEGSTVVGPKYRIIKNN